jgi:hypothetical protein
MLDDTLERVNISLPRRVLYRLDARAKRTGETRSGLIARMAIEGRDRAPCTPDGSCQAICRQKAQAQCVFLSTSSSLDLSGLR